MDKNLNTFETDFLVIGSGISGLTFALKAAELGKVIIISKGDENEGSTNLAQGGIAAVLPDSENDSFELHIKDTLRAGAGLCKSEIVEKVVRYAPEVIRQLTEYGVNFSRRVGESDEIETELGREGGHSRNRIVHVADYTGKAIEETLLNQIHHNPNIKIWQNHMAIDLLTQHHLPNYTMRPWEDIECYGAYILDIDNEKVHKVLARKTILASGGAGKLYTHTTNTSVSTGDGIAMAYRAGARVSNMEFMQFHPTVLFEEGIEDKPSFLISEAVRGAGGILVDKHKNRIKIDHPMNELAPRDIVARAIDRVLKATGEKCVFIDIRHRGKKFIIDRFPNIYNNCLKRGIDITTDLIPVVPAAHYLCGGILVDENGRTDIKNLYACGEVSYTGIHGANRLASNSLLEAFAFANFCYHDIESKGVGSDNFPNIPDWDASGVFDRKEWVIIRHNYQLIRSIMWDYMGIVRSLSRLRRALKNVRAMWEEIDEFYRKNPVRRKILELRNMAYVSELMIRSALSRRESRGLHYIIDHPEPDARFAVDTILSPRTFYTEPHIP